MGYPAFRMRDYNQTLVIIEVWRKDFSKTLSVQHCLMGLIVFWWWLYDGQRRLEPII